MARRRDQPTTSVPPEDELRRRWSALRRLRIVCCDPPLPDDHPVSQFDRAWRDRYPTRFGGGSDDLAEQVAWGEEAAARFGLTVDTKGRTE